MGPDGLKSCVRPAERRNGGAEPSGAAPRPLPDPIDDVAEGGLWREALEVGQVGVWAWDLDTGRVAVDRVARRIWSFPEHGSVGIAEVVACIDPEDAPAVRAALAATRETGAECHVMFRIHPPSGGSRWIRLRGRLQDGPASRVVGVTLDITERKRMEADLTATEERLRRAQELGGALPFEWDSRTDEVTAGAAFKALYGAEGGETLRMADMMDRIHPDDRERVDRDQRRLLLSPGPFVAEFRLTSGEGGERWILSRGESVLDATGGATRVAGIQMDITSRKLVEQELRRSRREAQERFRELKALYQNAPVGLALLDLDLRFLRVNEFLAELNGLPVDEHLGRTLFEVAPHLEAGLGPTLMSVLATGEPVRNVEIEAAAGGGEPRAWRFHLHPLRDEAGAVSGIAAVAEDVTERRRTERSRDLLSRELSHRIKNLFAVVSSLISLSARGDDRLQEFSRTIRGRVEALGRAHDTVRPVEWGSDRGDAPTLHKLLRTLLAPYRDEDDRRIRIHGCDPVVGPTAATAMGLAIHEFATNAVKYGGLSAPFGHVDIACGEAGDEVEIAWSEHGGPPVEGPPQREGFGSTLARRSLGGDLNAIIVTDWAREGLVVRIRLPRERLAR